MVGLDPETHLVNEEGSKFLFLDFHNFETGTFDFSAPPVSKNLVIRTQFISGEEGGNFARKSYFIFNPANGDPSKSTKIDKREANKQVTQYLLDYISRCQCLPSSVSLKEKRVTKQGKVTYDVTISSYDSFITPISPKDIATDNVSEFISSLPQPKPTSVSTDQSRTTNHDLLNEEDAAFYIIPYVEMAMRRVTPSKKTPSKAGLIIKVKFEERDGRRFPNKSFYLYEPDQPIEGSEKVGKREATNKLTPHLVEFINTHGHRPARTSFEIKSRTKDGKVRVEVSFSQYDSFNFTLEPKDFGVDDISVFLPTVGTHPDDDVITETEQTWKIEYAKSSRAKCRSCGDKIQKDELRIGEPSFYQEHLSYKWHHLKCVSNPPEGIEGLDNLKEEDKENVSEWIGNKGFNNRNSPKDMVMSIIKQFEDGEGVTRKADVLSKTAEQGLSEDEVLQLLTELEDEGRIYTPMPGRYRRLA